MCTYICIYLLARQRSVWKQGTYNIYVTLLCSLCYMYSYILRNKWTCTLRCMCPSHKSRKQKPIIWHCTMCRKFYLCFYCYAAASHLLIIDTVLHVIKPVTCAGSSTMLWTTTTRTIVAISTPGTPPSSEGTTSAVLTATVVLLSGNWALHNVCS